MNKFSLALISFVLLLSMILGCSSRSVEPESQSLAGARKEPFLEAKSIQIILMEPQAGRNFKLDQPILVSGKVECPPTQSPGPVIIEHNMVINGVPAIIHSETARCQKQANGEITFTCQLDGRKSGRKPGRYTIRVLYGGLLAEQIGKQHSNTPNTPLPSTTFAYELLP